MACFLKKMDQLALEIDPDHLARNQDSFSTFWKVIDILPWLNYLAFDIIGKRYVIFFF
jgi:hypothetical protein